MANKYNFDKEIDRRQTHSYKWNIPNNYISLSIADTDFMVADEIQKAIIERAKNPTYGYTFVPDEYYEAYINWWKRHHNVTFKKEWFCFSTSIVASIDSIIKRLSNPNDGVCVLSPNYNVFYDCIKNNNRKIIEVPFDYKDYQYSINWELLEKGLIQSKIFIHCNPHNPFGKIYSEEENNLIIELCKKYDVYILSDEIHCDLDYNENRYVPMARCNHYDKLITLLSPGKVFNLAGLHSSVVVIEDKDIRELIEKGLGEDDVGEPSYFSIEPVVAAYNECEEYVKEENEYIKENKAFLKEFFDKNGLNLKIIDGSCTYLLWIDISNYSRDSEDFAKRFKEEENIIVIDGKHYHEFYSSFIRINIATQKKNIIHLCESLKKFLSK